MTEFPGKGQTDSPHPLVSLVLGGSHPKPGEKKKLLSYQCLTIDTLARCQLY